MAIPSAVNFRVLVLLSLVVLLLLLAGHVQADDPPKLAKPALKPPLNDVAERLINLLPVTAYQIETWEWGFVPESCAKHTVNHTWSPADLVVFSVRYNDCELPWIFCRHRQSDYSQREMAETFGRLPVKMRNYVRHAISLPRSWPVAFAEIPEGDLLFLGCYNDSQALTLWAHETGHHMDFRNGRNVKGSNGEMVYSWFTDTPAWIDAYNNDSAVSGDYARNNQMENFAQEINIALWDKNLPGGLDSTGLSQWHEVEDQIRSIQNKLGDQLLPGGTCDVNGRKENPGISDKIICMPGAKNCLAMGGNSSSTEGQQEPQPYQPPPRKLPLPAPTTLPQQDPPGTTTTATATKTTKATPTSSYSSRPPPQGPRCRHQPRTTTASISTNSGSTFSVNSNTTIPGYDHSYSRVQNRQIASGNHGQDHSNDSSYNSSDLGQNKNRRDGESDNNPNPPSISWENIPINKSSAAIEGQSDKVSWSGSGIGNTDPSKAL